MPRQTSDEDSSVGLKQLAERLAAGLAPVTSAVGDASGGRTGRVWDSGILAIGWGTVDLERSAAELPEIAFDFAPDDEAMGGRALIGHPGTIALVLLEPATEGRLAATLAHNGEGIAVIYQQARGLPLEGASRMTPLGRPGRVADPGQRFGPFLIVVE